MDGSPEKPARGPVRRSPACLSPLPQGRTRFADAAWLPHTASPTQARGDGELPIDQPRSFRSCPQSYPHFFRDTPVLCRTVPVNPGLELVGWTAGEKAFGGHDQPLGKDDSGDEAGGHSRESSYPSVYPSFSLDYPWNPLDGSARYWS